MELEAYGHNKISIHALREEGDRDSETNGSKTIKFLSTPSARRATPDIGGGIQDFTISIHTLREEGDGRSDSAQTSTTRISIHALREEGDQLPLSVRQAFGIFLSTPSARRATCASILFIQNMENFYPRPPRGGRPARPGRPGPYEEISIHALREEGDDLQSGTDQKGADISIHALREEGDKRTSGCLPTPQNFYPRPPRGGRRTTSQAACRPHKKISIHALREEGDTHCRSGHTPKSDFYPRPPRGGRQQKQRQNLYFQTNYTTFCTNLEEP